MSPLLGRKRVLFFDELHSSARKIVNSIANIAQLNMIIVEDLTSNMCKIFIV